MSNQLRLDVAQLTDVGRKRPHNEDHMAHVIPKDPQILSKKGALFVVADGMGGHAAGEIASEIAVETISVVYYQDDSEDVSTSLVHAIKRANTLIHQRAAENMLRSGMGTTCVAAVLCGSTAYIANVGDSRLYLVRRNKVQQISQDHSWVAEQVRAKILTEEQARSHAQRNVITRCLGTQTDVDVDLFIEPLEVGDALVLCSDGLSGLVEEDELLGIVNQYVPQESVYHLIERANERGGTDNITAIVVRVQEVGWEPTPVLKNTANGHGNGTNGYSDRGIDAIATMPTLGLPPYQQKERNSESLRYSSGPLGDDFSQFTPQPRKRRRVVYSALIIALLVLVAVVGSGIFYLFRLNSVDISGTLSKAQTLIVEANNEVATTNPSPNPKLALQYLATAQSELQSLQGNSSLTDTQKNQLTKLLYDDLKASVVTAVNVYNQQAFIVPASCINPASSLLNTGSTGATVTNIVTVLGPKSGNTLFYALGSNNILYQLSSGKSLVNPLTKWSPAVTQVVAVAADGPRLLALTKVPAQTNAPASYSLSVLIPSDNGSLTIANSQKIQPTPSNAPLQTPTLITAWGSDVFVVLTSTTNLTMTVAHYAVTVNNKLDATPDIATVTTSTSLLSIAAFPGKQLFFLLKDGTMQSMQFAAGSQTSTQVLVSSPVSQPLPIEGSKFVVNTPVPTPIAQPTVTQNRTFLNIPNANLLVAGTVNDVSHLYIVDSVDHRILSLKSDNVGVASNTTPVVGNSGASTSSAVTLQLDRQFVDTQLPSILSVVTDPNPKNPQVYLLTSDTGKMENLFSLNPNQSSVCNG